MKKLILVSIVLSLFFVLPVYGRNMVFEWDQNTEDDIAGYRLYQMPEDGIAWEIVADIPYPRTTVRIEAPQGKYHYVSTAYDTEAFESEHSNEVIFVAYYYNSVRYDYDSNRRIIYKGEHTDHNASVDDTNWLITKYYYNASGMVNHVRIRTTSWTNRAIGW